MEMMLFYTTIMQSQDSTQAWKKLGLCEHVNKSRNYIYPEVTDIQYY